jgi:hypothetical protein
MLRLYKPIQHEIFKLHEMLKHLVCIAWCEASTSDSCESKLDDEFKAIYLSYDWLKNAIDEIYTLCKSLTPDERKAIKDAFEANNKIEELCNGTVKPIPLSQLHKVVVDKIKPLMVNFYEDLLEKAKVPGTKKDYYEKLVEENGFKDCPCCGLTYFEPKDSDNREAFDHYLPKALYPFASVNFQNLVPLCYKCNSDRKKAKDPIEMGNKAFYPFSKAQHSIGITIKIDHTKDLRKLERTDLKIEFIGDNEKIDTWNRLFASNERYNDTSRDILKSMVRKIKRRHQDYKGENAAWSYSNTLDKLIADYEFDKFDDKKFLKIPIMAELKNCSELIEVYS